MVMPSFTARKREGAGARKRKCEGDLIPEENALSGGRTRLKALLPPRRTRLGGFKRHGLTRSLSVELARFSQSFVTLYFAHCPGGIVTGGGGGEGVAIEVEREFR